MPPSAAATIKPLRIIHIALTVSPVLFSFAAVMMTSGKAAPALDPTITMALVGGLAVAILIAAPLVAARMMPRLAKVSDGRRRDLARFEDEDGRAALGKLRQALIVRWSMTEAVANFGLVAAVLLNDALAYGPFGLVAIASLVRAAPTDELYQSVLRALPDRAGATT
ncbi:MAG: hypothetical protein K8W52_39955 [Deltaproteobacteria bacterium]|nr:hypothetical protein [Deltaproteobacteria bacterium]